MDYSAANTALWSFVIQCGYIAAAILAANFLVRKFNFIRKSLMPVSVLAGLMLLVLKCLGILNLNNVILEMLVYHGIALGFIAMGLRVPDESQERAGRGLKSGALIVSTYLVQGFTGLVITMGLGYTLKPDMFKAAGLLLPMGYGQGPGQANNVGSTYEALGFAGGRSFGLSIAFAGYLCACVVGILIINSLIHRGKIQHFSSGNHESRLTVDFFQNKNELPVSDSLDKLSVQLAMVLVIYFATYLVTWGITSGISAISLGLANTVNTLIWGFNFIVASAMAILVRVLLEKGKKAGIIERQYQNNYLLNRISGFFFDIMIVTGIASINVADLEGLWLPFVLMAAAGGVVTWFFLKLVCKRLYKGYYYEGLLSMYGMLTGTISSGVLLLRELDGDLHTPAANNLVTGSSFGIIFGAPMLLLIGMAPKSDLMCWITMGIVLLYLGFLLLLIYKVKDKE